jgi:hypothetical protein
VSPIVRFPVAKMALVTLVPVLGHLSGSEWLSPIAADLIAAAAVGSAALLAYLLRAPGESGQAPPEP